MDDIYRNTSWDDEFIGYGVQIQQVRTLKSFFNNNTWALTPELLILSVSCQIIIEKSPSTVAAGKSHFNMKGSPLKGKDVWDVKKLLEVKPDGQITRDVHLIISYIKVNV